MLVEVSKSNLQFGEHTTVNDVVKFGIYYVYLPADAEV